MRLRSLTSRTSAHVGGRRDFDPDERAVVAAQPQQVVDDDPVCGEIVQETRRARADRESAPDRRDRRRDPACPAGKPSSCLRWRLTRDRGRAGADACRETRPTGSSSRTPRRQCPIDASARSFLLRRRIRRRRLGLVLRRPLLLDRRADRHGIGAGAKHHHRVTRDVDADRSAIAVRVPLDARCPARRAA